MELENLAKVQTPSEENENDAQPNSFPESLTPSSHDDVNEDKNEEEDHEEEENQDEFVELRYRQKFILVLKLLPISFDHISDIFVLVKLLQGNYIALFFIGIFIDLLPGPVTAVQFHLIGYQKPQCFSLLFHPINAHLHTFIVICGNKKWRSFSLKVSEYSNFPRNAKVFWSHQFN